jgi:hypothetical protein
VSLEILEWQGRVKMKGREEGWVLWYSRRGGEAMHA